MRWKWQTSFRRRQNYFSICYHLVYRIKTDFSWINHRVTDEKGYPIGERGVSSILDGLYFVGMLFQFAMNSHLIGGVGKDAAFIARHIHEHSILRRKHTGQRMAKEYRIISQINL